MRSAAGKTKPFEEELASSPRACNGVCSCAGPGPSKSPDPAGRVRKGSCCSGTCGTPYSAESALEGKRGLPKRPELRGLPKSPELPAGSVSAEAREFREFAEAAEAYRSFEERG